jgi:hypothetical protein
MKLGDLPPMQKAVIHAIKKSGIANDPDGTRAVSADNQYGAYKLASLMEASLEW